MDFLAEIGTALDLGLVSMTLTRGQGNLETSQGLAPIDSGSGARQKNVEAKQGGPDVDHQCSDVGVAPRGISKTRDGTACLLDVCPIEIDNAAGCGGVQDLPVDMIRGFDAVVGDLKDKTTIQDVSEIKKKLGLITDVYGLIVNNIKEAGERRERRFLDRFLRDIVLVEGSATELYGWARGFVPDKPDSSGAMTKQAKLQVVPYIVVLVYATLTRVMAQLFKRDITTRECDKARHLDRVCEIVDDFIAVLHRALEGLMANTSLLEIALDYQLPMAMYLTLMTSLRARVDALKSPGTRPEQITVWDDGLSYIREAFHWRPSGAGGQGQESIIKLRNLEESAWWARFTDTDLRVVDNSYLRRIIDVREISQVLGARSGEIADKLAQKPGKKSALLQLPPASALRSTLCANITKACNAALRAPLPPLSFQNFARIWVPPSPVRIAALRTLSGHTQQVTGVAVCPDGERVLSGSLDGTARVWHLSSGQPLRTFSGHTDCVYCVAVGSDGKTAVSGSADKSVRVWSLDGDSAQHTLLQGHSDLVWAVALSPDGRIVASGSDDRTVKLWNVDTGQCEATLAGHSCKVRSVAFSPDGETLVSGNEDGSIKVWSVRTRALKRTLRGHSGTVFGVAVMPDGRRLISGSDDWTVRIWSLSSGEEEMMLAGHNEVVACVAVFPDGERIASGSWDNTVRVWNVSSGAPELELKEHRICVECVAVSPDGRSVVSGSADRTLKVWDVSRGADS